MKDGEKEATHRYEGPRVCATECLDSAMREKKADELRETQRDEKQKNTHLKEPTGTHVQHNNKSGMRADSAHGKGRARIL